MKRRLLLVILVFVVVFVAVAAFAALRLRGSGLPARDGEHPLAGLDAAVEVRWGRWGVPYVAAASEEDAAAALGWLHANDRADRIAELLDSRDGWDVAGFAEPGGQSGHPADVHYDDRIAPYLAGELQQAPWSPAAIEAATVSTLKLRPTSGDRTR
jgi:acyl-homoserine lactone acylase PvdQ